MYQVETMLPQNSDKMKKYLFALIYFLLLYSCENEPGPIEYAVIDKTFTGIFEYEMDLEGDFTPT